MQPRKSVLLALLIILFVYFEIHSCSKDTSVSPTPPEPVESVLCNANDVFFLDASHGWVVGQEGTIIRTFDAGADWNKVKLEDNIDIRSIMFIDEAHGWIVGRGGMIFSSSDGGASWQRVLFPATPEGEDLYKVEFKTDDIGFVLGYHGVFVTDDGGDEWENNWLPVVAARGAWNMCMLDDRTGYLLGSKWTDSDPELLYRTEDGGKNWSSVPGSNASILKSVVTIDFISEDIGYAGGGVIMKTTDGGITWTCQKNEATVREFCFLDAENGYAVGATSVLKTIDGGSDWADVTPQSDRLTDLRAVYFLDSQKGWVAGRGVEEVIGGRKIKYSVLLSTDDGGVSWNISEFPYDVTDIESSSLQTEQQ